MAVDSSTPGATADMVMILGAGRMQIPAIEAAGRLGLRTLVVDGDPQALARGLADIFVAVDLADLQGLAQLAARYCHSGRLRGVFTAGTDFSTSVAYIAEQCGLPGIPYSSALDASDKLRMRRRFADSGIPSPRWVSCSDAADCADLRLPLVVKPVDSMGARGVRRVNSRSELAAALAAARACSRSGRALAEEYIDGPEYSLDAIVDSGRIEICGIAERHIRFAPWFVEVGHTLPAVLPTPERHELAHWFRAAIRALGIEYGAAKGDIFLTRHGAMVGEVAARLSGGFMSGWTYPLASGVDVTAAALRIAIGEAPGALTARLNRVSAERALISIPGLVARLAGTEEVAADPAIQACFMRARAGERVVFPRNNVEKCANVIAVAAERSSAVGAAEDAIRRLQIELQPGDRGTLAFLFGREGRRYPYAFSLCSAANRRALVAMPKGSACSALWQPHFPHNKTALQIAPLPEMIAESQRDWHIRTLAQTLAELERSHAIQFVSGAPSERCFWQAVLKGGLQGGRFFLDTVKREPRRMEEWINQWDGVIE